MTYISMCEKEKRKYLVSLAYMPYVSLTGYGALISISQKVYTPGSYKIFSWGRNYKSYVKFDPKKKKNVSESFIFWKVQN